MQNNVEFNEEIETIFEKFWEELNNVPVSNELHLIVVDRWKTQLVSKNNKNIKLCEISVKYDTYNANLILLGKDSEIVDYYICTSDIIHIKNAYIYHYKDIIQIFPTKNSTLKIIRVGSEKDFVDIQEDVLEITLDVRTQAQDIVAILFEKFRDRFIEIQYLQNWYECFVHKPVEDTFDEFYEDKIHDILETELDKTEIKCKNLNNHFCNMNVHSIMVKMGAKESYSYKCGLFEKYVEYLCCWDDIPEKKEDCNILKDFLRKKFNIDWIEKAEIKKRHDNAISIYTPQKNFLSILHRKYNEAIITTDDLRTGILTLKQEYRKLNIYYQKYPIFEGEECLQYLQQYVPLHLPQISLVLKKVIKYIDANNIFDSYTLNILDIGSGPATVPLALCRLKNDELKNRKFKITTIEASEGFNKMIEKFREAKPGYIETINNLKYNLEALPGGKVVFDKSFKVNWIIIANAISAIGEGRTYQEVNIILNKFIMDILHCKNENEKIMLTIIEGGEDSYFPFIDYLCEIENISFANLNVIKLPELQVMKQIGCPQIKECRFYKTSQDIFKPYLNTTSLLLELKNE